MQNVKQFPSIQPQKSQHIVRLAWLVLFAAFGLFCTLTITSGYTAWRYRTQAMITQDSTLIVRTDREWVSWKRKDRTAFERPVDEQAFAIPEGAKVQIDKSAGYGQAATVRLFDQSTIDMWAGADVQLDTVQTSRWSQNQQTVVLHQFDGYIRYDISSGQAYQNVDYRVIAGGATIDLAPGGSYSIEIAPPPPDRRMQLADNTSPVFVDIAVRSQGVAEVSGADRTVRLTAGQRVVVDPAGIPALPIPARWDLIRDGSFSQYTEAEYNNTTQPEQVDLPQARTWQVSGNVAEPEAVENGFFTLARSCPPPNPTTDCDSREWRNAAGFMRNGDQTKSFVTSVEQTLGPYQEGVDISEYRSLTLSAWVRILDQSIPLTGERGTECPVMMRLTAKNNSPSDPEQRSVICVYSSNDATQESVRAPGIAYYQVAPFEWYHLEIELRNDEWLPEAKYLHSIQIYANGHDYNSRVTEVSLIGIH